MGQPSAGTLIVSEAEAIDRALATNADLRIFRETEGVAAGVRSDASFFANPEIEFEVETAPRKSVSPTLRNPESYTVRLAQAVRFPGRALAARESATAREDVYRLELARKVAEVRSSARESFFVLLAKQREAELVTARVALAKEFLAIARARVEAGKVSPLEADRLESAVRLNEADLVEAQAKRQEAGFHLAALWSTPTSAPSQEMITAGGAALADLREPPGDVDAALARNARIPLLNALARQARADLAVETQGLVPDLTLGAGLTRFSESHFTGYTFSIGLPLPLFERNGTGRALAKAEEAARRIEAETAVSRSSLNVQARLARLKAAFLKARILSTEVVPQTRRTAELVREAYANGRLAALDALEAQSRLAEVQRTELESVAEYHSQRIQFERLFEEAKSNSTDSAEGKLR